MYVQDYTGAGTGFPEDADDPECGCAHPVSLHDGPAGECTGKGKDMRDPGDYPWIAPDEACACTRYEGSV